MQTLVAFRALWQGIRDPRGLERTTTNTAVAIFAAAILIVTLAATVSVYLEQASPSLKTETTELNVLTPEQMAPEQGAAADASADNQQRKFTAIFGGALIRSVMSLVAMGFLFWMLTRFMTNVPVQFSAGLAAVSATAGIEVLRTLVYIPLHLAAGTVQAGLHAGAFVVPVDHPFLFLWLQRLDLFSVWHYLAAGIMLAGWSGLHYRYGWVIGGVVFTVVQILMAGLTLVAWVVRQGM